MAGVDEAAFQTSLGAETDVLILVLLRVMQVGVSSAWQWQWQPGVSPPGWVEQQ